MNKNNRMKDCIINQINKNIHLINKYNKCNIKGIQIIKKKRLYNNLIMNLNYSINKFYLNKLFYKIN